MKMVIVVTDGDDSDSCEDDDGGVGDNMMMMVVMTLARIWVYLLRGSMISLLKSTDSGSEALGPANSKREGVA